MQKVNQEQQFRDIIAGDKLTIAVFKAVWCKDCHFIDPFMPDLEKQYADQVTFIELDRDEVLDLCDELNILGIPSFIAFRNGQEVVRFVSKLRKTREEIEQFVDRAIAVSTELSK
ncbi:thioredoxin family protein [Paenibacillus sp. N1-5-1-14]|uniref:thioredoxin family protein n=1 Tax=Paenibacillus radicibacter TaxID=2972488 RepID=UPI00215955C4|nr:thioredoxin family protein [Paenibacillus radicibacter]MCR8645292.1 thioredoxin family protein [Paenibacillus radicibacter]